MNDIFERLVNILHPEPVKIQTIFDDLNYSSYCVQRDAGITHEVLSKYACWNNETFKTKYDATHKK